jgi:hypothetical protein
LAHSVSSSDLAAWWNGADAGETLMILDSCHSGAAAGKEFDPDHSGDPGLGQLRYDKGEVHGPNFDSDHSQEFVDVPEQDNILVRIKSSRSLWRWLTRSMISGGPIRSSPARGFSASQANDTRFTLLDNLFSSSCGTETE